jgi:uncharacterized membrane protein YgaE (UPF0421/DUF939 family)
LEKVRLFFVKTENKMDKELKDKITESIEWLAGFIVLILISAAVHALIEINPIIMLLVLLTIFTLIFYFYRRWKKKK